MGVLSWLMAYEKLMSALVFLISFFVVIVSMVFFYLCVFVADSILPFIF